MADIAGLFLILGSAYVISNQSNDNVENLSNQFPDVNPLDTNYPINNPTTNQNVHYFHSPNQSSDKYYNQNTFNQISKSTPITINPPTFNSLMGTPIDRNNFNHNNMSPYFGGKIRGSTADKNTSESMLDNLQGSGSQYIKKNSIAPLFKPEDNMHNVYGAPNNNDFYQSRVNPSMSMNNTKPWEEQRIGPGLNKGYGTNGSNGFNSGMESRDSWLPHTVDELRVKTNPKITFNLSGHEGPISSTIKNVGILGKVEKNRPDTDFNNGPERWLTTTGAIKGNTSHAEEILHDVNRTTTTQEYFGNYSSTLTKEMAPQYYQAGFKTEQNNTSIAGPNVNRHGPATTGDYAVQSINFLPNNRTTTSSENYGFFGTGAIGAIVSPILDVLRPSRKENVVGNARIYGDASITVKNGQVFNPHDTAPVTNRQMDANKLDCNHLNVQNQKSDAYTLSQHTLDENNRDTTSVCYFNNGSDNSGPMTYNANYEQQRLNPNKSYELHPNQGNMELFNGSMNIKIDKLDSDRNNTRQNIITSGNYAPPSIDNYGPIASKQQYKDIANERMQPDILSAFKENPYTHSLNSWA